MPTLKITEWEFSNLKVEERTALSEGEHLLYIIAASYYPTEEYQRFTLTFKSLTKDNEESKMQFYLSKNGVMNERVYGTLNSLKHALAGPETGEGLLAPCDIEHGLVRATVKMGKPWIGQDNVERVSPVIYHFEPVTADEYFMAGQTEELIEQYYTE